ncbi:unnamed protein product [Heligmosomoides polygyrus]|uniref:Neur_chan_memb domain-containing protein n=1 Tax=Heligmosomoides polygyrus TaxID=6339 RepID=A0A183F5G6_HELPZ|nr:unnamed protein product [Heligmosomoides polygyrus]
MIVAAIYIGLPLVPFRRRDIVFASGFLLYLVTLAATCAVPNGAVISPNCEKVKSSGGSHIDDCDVSVQLVFCFMIVLISYCRRAFETNEKGSSNASLMPSSLRQSQQVPTSPYSFFLCSYWAQHFARRSSSVQLQPYWAEAAVAQQTKQKRCDDYHFAPTMVRKAEAEGNKK